MSPHLTTLGHFRDDAPSVETVQRRRNPVATSLHIAVDICTFLEYAPRSLVGLALLLAIRCPALRLPLSIN